MRVLTIFAPTFDMIGLMALIFFENRKQNLVQTSTNVGNLLWLKLRGL